MLDVRHMNFSLFIESNDVELWVTSSLLVRPFIFNYVSSFVSWGVHHSMEQNETREVMDQFCQRWSIWSACVDRLSNASSHWKDTRPILANQTSLPVNLFDKTDDDLPLSSFMQGALSSVENLVIGPSVPGSPEPIKIEQYLPNFMRGK